MRSLSTGAMGDLVQVARHLKKKKLTRLCVENYDSRRGSSCGGEPCRVDDTLIRTRQDALCGWHILAKFGQMTSALYNDWNSHWHFASHTPSPQSSWWRTFGERCTATSAQQDAVPLRQLLWGFTRTLGMPYVLSFLLTKGFTVTVSHGMVRTDDTVLAQFIIDLQINCFANTI